MDDLGLEHPDLEEYFDTPDASLPPRVREHLDRCEACREELATLTSIRLSARGLPREIEPSRDLWPGIAAKISRPTPGNPPIPLTLRRTERPSAPGWRGLAAAAVAMMVLSAGTTAWLLREETSRAQVAVAAPAETQGAGSAGLAAFAASEDEYRDVVTTLEAELEARRANLSPATIAAVEENIAIIDAAIAEARQALASDSSSVDLPLMLAGIYRQKVDLLRRAVELSSRS